MSQLELPGTDDSKPPQSDHRAIVVAGLTAAATTVATALATWLVDEFRARYGRANPDDSTKRTP